MYTLLCGHKSRTEQGFRGNCFKCYIVLKGRVRRGSTTWAQLEAEGKVKKAASPQAKD